MPPTAELRLEARTRGMAPVLLAGRLPLPAFLKLPLLRLALGLVRVELVTPAGTVVARSRLRFTEAGVVTETLRP